MAGKIDLKSLPEEILIVPDFISIVGKSVSDDGEDLDILIRGRKEDHEGTMTLLEKVLAGMDLDGKKIHFIFAPTGPHADYLPIYDLAIRKRAESKIVKIKEAKLTSKGESPGGGRMDFMAGEPSQIPGTFRLWRHWRGIPEDSKNKSEEALRREKQGHSIHYDLRLYWGKDYLEGITLFTPGGSHGKDKLLAGNQKIACTLKQKNPVIWNKVSEMDGRLFEPGEVGNVAGKDTWGKMFLADEGKYMPLRIRNVKGKRYYELAMKFDKHPNLTGIWAISEEAAGPFEQIEFLFFRLESKEPFHIRNEGKKDKQDEIAGMADWQKPTEEKVKSFLGG